MTEPFEPDDQAQTGHRTYGLVMPFVVCQSKGGPYQDDAFCAGWQCGEIDKALEVAAATQAQTVYIEQARTALIPQLELIGMRYGFGYQLADVSAQYPDWCQYTFSKQPIGLTLSTEEGGQ